MEQNIDDLMEITDSLEQKIRAAESISWDEVQYALACITEEKDKGLYGLVCYYAAFYMITQGRPDECLCYLNESIRCMKGTAQESNMARCYNLSGVVAHTQNNLILAMEHYEKAYMFSEQYHSYVVRMIAISNMANTYYRAGAYERAISCYVECINQLEMNTRSTVSVENLYRRIMANYGYCLIMTDDIEQALSVADRLKPYMDEPSESSTVNLAIYNFLALLFYRNGDEQEAEKYTDMAVRAVMDGCTIFTDLDHILNLIEYLSQAKKNRDLQKVLDCMEPQAAIEKNESFLLQLLLYRLRYCTEEMDQQSFLKASQTFFGLKGKHEFSENSQVLRITGLRNKLRKIEEEQARLVEENTKLLYQMEHDELSGLYSKRHLNRYMEEVFEEALQKELPLGVMFVDIDHFKEMNDKYGHQEGDNCVIAIADAIKTCMPGDFAARYGGDEFVIITKNRTKEYLQEHAQMLIDCVKAKAIPNEDSKTMNIVSITIGAAHAIPHKPNKIWDFLSAADETLYLQKNEKKGCARFYVGQENGL